MGNRLKRLLKTLLKFAVTGVALFLVIRKIDVAEVAALYRQSDFLLLFLALIAFTLSKLVTAFRLNLYFAAIDLKIKQSVNVRLYLLGMFYNLFLPGGIGGDGYKIYLLQKHFSAGTKKILGAVLCDRISGMVALVVMALIGFAFLDPGTFQIPDSRFHPPAGGPNSTLNTQHSTLNTQHLTLILIPLAFLAYYLFIKYVYPYFLKINLVTFGYGFVVQLFQVLCAWLLLLALGEQDNHLAYLVIFLVSSVVAVLPISVGGVGVRELTFLFGSQILNVDMNIAVGISFLFYLITAVVSLSGMCFVFRPIMFRES